MANIVETETWDDGVYQLETTDPVQGGADGVDNAPHKNLANRTLWLKAQVALKALLNGSNLERFKVADAVSDDEAVNKAQVQALIAALVDSSPAALDTLNELAAALGDDPNFATTITNALATKAALAGLSTQTFSVATGTEDNHAVNKLQMENAIANVKQVTGTATFTNSTNTLTLTGIGNIGIEIGDVIEITGSVSNNGLYTAEILTDVNNIVFNYEHRGQTKANAPKAFTNETSTANVTVTIYCKAKYASSGLGKDWCIPTSGRTNNVSATNPFPYDLAILVTGIGLSGMNGELNYNNKNIARFDSASWTVIFTTIGSGKFYKTTNTSISYFYEKR
ncbi:hypothetical protein ACOTV5_02370 [Aliarcobacter butzleri]|uniref:hypothetical protein n=1 Tax=Aliarcobacter butzleri TaxID=28197 RepID=UPI003AFA35F3